MVLYNGIRSKELQPIQPILGFKRTMDKINKLSELQEINVNYNRNYGKDKITNSFRASEVCRQAFSSNEDNICLKEYMYMLLLNKANELIGWHKLSEGGVTGTTADVRIAFSIAVKCLASGMILCHNHPSDNTKPSQADIALTKKFVEAGKILDCTLLDHIILTEDEFYSFADEDLL
jgi:DNA repair protein RadC